MTGDDPKAAKLARVLAFYAERLPPEERELLARLSVFPRGVTLGAARHARRCRRRGGGAAREGQAAPRRAAEQPEGARAGVRVPQRHERHLDGASVPARAVPGTARLPGREGVRRGGAGARRRAGEAAGDEAERSERARPLRAADRGDAARGAGAGGVRSVLVWDGGLRAPRLGARRVPARLSDPGGVQRDRAAGGPRADDGAAGAVAARERSRPLRAQARTPGGGVGDPAGG